MFEISDLAFKHILHIKEVTIDRQITCIIGASGCGKTTLLRMLNRLQEADRGCIKLHGESIQDMDPIQLRRDVVMLGQTPILYPGTIEDNLQIGLKLSEKPLADKETLMMYMKKVNLTKALDEECSKLSGGEKQRLCLARVLLMDAQVYLADEPSAALDKETEKFVIDNLVAYVKEHGKQLVMVTHSDEIAKAYPESLMKIEDGDMKGYMYE